MSHEWLNTVDAAELIQCHPATLANWRYQRRGPPFERRTVDDRKRIVYRRDRLLRWAVAKGIVKEMKGSATQ